MKKLNGMILALFAFAAMALVVGCSGGGATSEEQVKEDMANIDKGLEGVGELPPEAQQGPIPKGPGANRGGAGAATTTGS